MTNKTYEQGFEEGYGYAIQKIFDALGIKLNGTQEEEESPEFLNKPIGQK